MAFLVGALAAAGVGLLIFTRAGTPTEEAVGGVFILTSVVGAAIACSCSYAAFLAWWTRDPELASGKLGGSLFF